MDSYKIMIIDRMPVVLDRAIHKIISRLNIKWHIHGQGVVMGLYNNKHIPMHSIVMLIASKLYQEINICDLPILHINRINLDNRVKNLMYDSDDKDINKTCRKKKRIIDLSRKGIKTATLPTYIWYMKPDKTHGERFIIQIKNIVSWKSSSSKTLSLRYKLEESKKYLRDMLKNKPELFNRSMNGDLTSSGYSLYREYEKIIESAGYQMNQPGNNTYNFLKPDYSGLSPEEINQLVNPGA